MEAGRVPYGKHLVGVPPASGAVLLQRLNHHPVCGFRDLPAPAAHYGKPELAWTGNEAGDETVHHKKATCDSGLQ